MFENNNSIKKYGDIIDMPHHVSNKRPHMPVLDRAAQFAPFAALTGHDKAVKETARLTEKRIELDEGEIETINGQLQLLRSRMHQPGFPENETELLRPAVDITYFVKDDRKEGGKYITVSGRLKRFNDYEGSLTMEDGTVIPVKEIIKIK